MFEYFYNEIFRKTVIGFGTLFNNIEVRQINNENEIKFCFGSEKVVRTEVTRFVKRSLPHRTSSRA